MHCSSWFPAADTNEKSISCVLTGNASSASQERRADVSIAFKITNKLISGPVCSPGNEKEKGCGERWNLELSRQIKVSSSCLPQCIVRFVPHRLSQVIPSLPWCCPEMPFDSHLSGCTLSIHWAEFFSHSTYLIFYCLFSFQRTSAAKTCLAPPPHPHPPYMTDLGDENKGLTAFWLLKNENTERN